MSFVSVCTPSYTKRPPNPGVPGRSGRNNHFPAKIPTRPFILHAARRKNKTGADFRAEPCVPGKRSATDTVKIPFEWDEREADARNDRVNDERAQKPSSSLAEGKRRGREKKGGKNREREKEERNAASLLCRNLERRVLTIVRNYESNAVPRPNKKHYTREAQRGRHTRSSARLLLSECRAPFFLSRRIVSRDNSARENERNT